MKTFKQWLTEMAGGYAMWYDATFVITFGNIMSAGTSKIKAIKNGKEVELLLSQVKFYVKQAKPLAQPLDQHQQNLLAPYQVGT